LINRHHLALYLSGRVQTIIHAFSAFLADFPVDDNPIFGHGVGILGANFYTTSA
jgi:hypothetical protein